MAVGNIDSHPSDIDISHALDIEYVVIDALRAEKPILFRELRAKWGKLMEAKGSILKWDELEEYRIFLRFGSELPEDSIFTRKQRFIALAEENKKPLPARSLEERWSLEEIFTKAFFKVEEMKGGSDFSPLKDLLKMLADFNWDKDIAYVKPIVDSIDRFRRGIETMGILVCDKQELDDQKEPLFEIDFTFLFSMIEEALKNKGVDRSFDDLLSIFNDICIEGKIKGMAEEALLYGIRNGISHITRNDYQNICKALIQCHIDMKTTDGQKGLQISYKESDWKDIRFLNVLEESNEVALKMPEKIVIPENTTGGIWKVLLFEVGDQKFLRGYVGDVTGFHVDIFRNFCSELLVLGYDIETSNELRELRISGGNFSNNPVKVAGAEMKYVDGGLTFTKLRESEYYPGECKEEIRQVLSEMGVELK